MKHTRTQRFIAALKANKLMTFIVIVLIIGGAIMVYRSSSKAGTAPKYLTAKARIATIATTIDGTGNISASNQVDVKSKTSGDVVRIAAKVGDHVKAGQLLVQLDARDASIALESSRISLAKLTKPADTEDIDKANDDIAKAYSDAWNALASTFLAYPSIMNSLNDLYYTTGYLSEQYMSHVSDTGRDLRNKSGILYDQSKVQYQTVLAEYGGLSRSSPAAATDVLIAHTLDAIKSLSEALKNTQDTVNYIALNQKEYRPTDAATAAANINSWLSTTNTNLSAILSAKNTIVSAKKSLTDLQKGADSLDIQSSQLEVRQKEYAYQDYFIRSPVDGLVARIPIKSTDTVSGGAVVATVINNRINADISLNEVDIARIEPNQPVRATFDAVDGLTVDGKVAEVDLVGTNNSGVVTYNVKVDLDADDPRVKPGMSVNVSIIVDKKEDVLAVPSGAVKTRGGKHYVEVVRNEPTAQASSSNSNRPVALDVAPVEVPVDIGVSNDNLTEIVSGLSAGEEVVSRTITSAPSASATPSLFGSGRSSAGTVRVGGGGGR